MAKKQSFEEKLEFAKELLEKLSEDNVSLNESVDLYKKGVKTLEEASKILENAKIVLNEEKSS